MEIHPEMVPMFLGHVTHRNGINAKGAKENRRWFDFGFEPSNFHYLGVPQA